MSTGINAVNRVLEALRENWKRDHMIVFPELFAEDAEFANVVEELSC